MKRTIAGPLGEIPIRIDTPEGSHPFQWWSTSLAAADRELGHGRCHMPDAGWRQRRWQPGGGDRTAGAGTGAPRNWPSRVFYPLTDHNLMTPSYLAYGKGYFLTYGMAKWFWDHYLNNDDDGRDWQASPLRAANKRGLPPAFVATAEFDLVRDEGEVYAESLRMAGNTVTAKRYDGQIHGFVSLLGVMDQGKHAIEDAAAVLRKGFSQL